VCVFVVLIVRAVYPFALEKRVTTKVYLSAPWSSPRLASDQSSARSFGPNEARRTVVGGGTDPASHASPFGRYTKNCSYPAAANAPSPSKDSFDSSQASFNAPSSLRRPTRVRTTAA
jgi:hypothetical protein